MLTSPFTRWFSSPSGHGPTANRPHAAEALPAPVRRPAAAWPAVEVAASKTADNIIIRVKGEARSNSTGALLAGLLGAAASRPALVILDLSELRFISSLAIGVLVAYRRGVVRTGGRVRLAAQLQPAVREALGRADLFDLFESSPDVGQAPNRQANPTAAASGDGE